jgi:hypothetical protein
MKPAQQEAGHRAAAYKIADVASPDEPLINPVSVAS